MSLPSPKADAHDDRRQTHGSRVAVAAQPLAARAGLDTMARGGNAVDAAIAVAAALMVVEPVSCGLGGDAFAIVRRDGRVYALNASGRAPGRAAPWDRHGPRPTLGWASVTVPGAVAGWIALSQRFGRLALADVLAPAIALADDGYAVTPLISRVWRGLFASCRRQPEVLACFYAEHPRGPQPGDRVRLPDVARSLRSLAASGGRSLYEGDLADALARHAEATGGTLTLDDLRSHRVEWDSPLTTRYRDATVCEVAPNSVGVSALIALAVLDHLGPAPRDLARRVHRQIEAMRLAFGVVGDAVADPAAMAEPAQALLEPARIAALAARIDPRRAAPAPRDPPSPVGGTSYLSTGDEDGTLVSYIQSSGPGFGAGVVVPGTGIALQNRAGAFDPRPDHPNAHAPRKRPLHSNCPALALRDDGTAIAFGLMGWSMQPQAHVQFVGHAIDDGLDPAAVLAAARWRIAAEEPAIVLEPELAGRIGEQLAALGHRIVETERFLPAATPFGSHLMFGGAAMVVARPGGGFDGAADPRRDGAALAD